MHIYVYSSTGCYNLCNPSEKSTNMYISVYEGEKRIKVISIKVDDEENWTNADFSPEYMVEELVEMIKEERKRYLYDGGRKGKDEFIKFIEGYREILRFGQWSYEFSKSKIVFEKAKKNMDTAYSCMHGY